MSTQPRKKYTISLSEQERQIIDEHAKALGTTRGELMRKRALTVPSGATGLPCGPNVYADALEAAARSYSGIPRTAMAGIVSAVIKSLADH